MKVNGEHQPANKNATEETYGGHKIKKVRIEEQTIKIKQKPMK